MEVAPGVRGLRAAAYTMMILPTVAVILRFWSRKLAQKAGLWWDDWTALATLPFIWAISFISLYWIHVGFGRHILQLLAEEGPAIFSTHLKLLFADSTVFDAGLALVRTSVLLQFIRIFGSVQRHKILCFAVLALNWVHCVSIELITIFSCTPVHKFWDFFQPGHCVPPRRQWLAASTSNIVIDIILLIMPVPMLWRLNIDRRHKVLSIGMFLAGYCVIIVSTIRLVSMLALGDPLRDDLTWNAVLTQTLVTCEVSVALISACLPSIFSLVKHVCGSLRHTNKAYLGKSMQHELEVRNSAEQVTVKNLCRITTDALSDAEAGLVTVEIFQ